MGIELPWCENAISVSGSESRSLEAILVALGPLLGEMLFIVEECAFTMTEPGASAWIGIIADRVKPAGTDPFLLTYANARFFASHTRYLNDYSVLFSRNPAPFDRDDWYGSIEDFGMLVVSFRDSELISIARNLLDVAGFGASEVTHPLLEAVPFGEQRLRDVPKNT